MNPFSRLRGFVEKGFERIKKIFSREEKTTQEKKDFNEKVQNIEVSIDQKIEAAIKKAQQENNKKIAKLQSEIETLKEKNRNLKTENRKITEQFNTPESQTIPVESLRSIEKQNPAFSDTPYYYRFKLDVENALGNVEEVHRTIRSAEPLSQEEAIDALDAMYEANEGDVYSSDTVVPGSIQFVGGFRA